MWSAKLNEVEQVEKLSCGAGVGRDCRTCGRHGRLYTRKLGARRFIRTGSDQHKRVIAGTKFAPKQTKQDRALEVLLPLLRTYRDRRSPRWPADAAELAYPPR